MGVELPAELIQKILAEADLATVIAAGGVNVAWRAVVKDVSGPGRKPAAGRERAKGAVRGSGGLGRRSLREPRSSRAVAGVAQAVDTCARKAGASGQLRPALGRPGESEA